MHCNDSYLLLNCDPRTSKKIAQTKSKTNLFRICKQTQISNKKKVVLLIKKLSKISLKQAKILSKNKNK